jgi:hypothetical protein
VRQRRGVSQDQLEAQLLRWDRPRPPASMGRWPDDEFSGNGLNALPAPVGNCRTDRLSSFEVDDEMVSVELGNLANQIGPHVAA